MEDLVNMVIGNFFSIHKAYKKEVSNFMDYEEVRDHTKLKFGMYAYIMLKIICFMMFWVIII